MIGVGDPHCSILMSRFVLLYHDCPNSRPRPSHWDLMLEQGDVLRTWSLAELPRDWAPVAEHSKESERVAPSNVVAAEALGDHRTAYLEFEGLLSDDRGRVTRVEAGTFDEVERSHDCWEVEIAGDLLRGLITLSRAAADIANWQLSYRSTRDES